MKLTNLTKKSSTSLLKKYKNRINFKKVGGKMEENKLITVEFSKDITKPNIAIIGAIREGKKIVKIYNVDLDKYEPKLKLKEVSHNKEDLEELMDNSELICELVFNANESIESLMYVLADLYKVKIEKVEE